MIYWDVNASTPLRPEVRDLLSQKWVVTPPGNASSVHHHGRAARSRLDAARSQVAEVLRADPREICFTGSGSESDALALAGAFLARKEARRSKIVTSAIEHPVVHGTLESLVKSGARIVKIRPNRQGRVSTEEFLAELTPDTALASLMWANNETGVLQPVDEVGRACRAREILFHSDAVQAMGKVPAIPGDVQADLFSLSAHKFGGPPGVGALFIRRGLSVHPLIPGHQEWGQRGGTHNLFFIEALAAALELSTQRIPVEAPAIRRLRDLFEAEILSRIPDVEIQGQSEPRVPNTSNVRFAGADGEALLIALDLEGISVSAGAACTSGTPRPSHVLTAMGLSSSDAQSCLRFSMGPEATEDQVSQVVDALVRAVPRARRASGTF